MYIKANIDDCAVIINDFLPNDLFKKISNFNFNFDSDSHTEWQKTLYLDKNDFRTMQKVNTQTDLAIICKDKVEAKDKVFEDFCRKLIYCHFMNFHALICTMKVNIL